MAETAREATAEAAAEEGVIVTAEAVVRKVLAEAGLLAVVEAAVAADLHLRRKHGKGWRCTRVGARPSGAWWRCSTPAWCATGITPGCAMHGVAVDD